MFTGIVEEVGIVENILHNSQNATITVRCHKILDGIKLGDSIAVNGLCLTVTSFDSTGFSADMMPVTLEKSSFGQFRQGSEINLERALQLQSRLGGHLISGHIDGTGQIISVTPAGNATIFRITADKHQLKYLIPEGSICVDGISLTIASIDDSSITISIIPHTIINTNLRCKHPGDLVNLETDMIGKYVYNFLDIKKKSGIEKGNLNELLSSNGFW